MWFAKSRSIVLKNFSPNYEQTGGAICKKFITQIADEYDLQSQTKLIRANQTSETELTHMRELLSYIAKTVTRLSTSLVKWLADKALDTRKKLQIPSSTAKTINILAQVEQILYMVQQSPSRSTAKALDPIIEALIAKELLNHPDIDVNILVHVASMMS
uniref:Phospholipase-like protein n=1 Tax=Tanacetum cinerariifolium TaxID=118510 RepID=A0A699IPZ4_TANCI|nr:phospholipase-like protein [Tanacetum cinerariifolium]